MNRLEEEFGEEYDRKWAEEQARVQGAGKGKTQPGPEAITDESNFPAGEPRMDSQNIEAPERAKEAGEEIDLRKFRNQVQHLVRAGALPADMNLGEVPDFIKQHA